MSSSGGGTVNAVLYVIVLACAVRSGAVLLGRDLARVLRRPPVAAVALWLIVAVPSLLQLAVPGLLRALERDPDQIRQHGQWWRLVTSVVVQDGGVAGTVFNLVILAIVAVVAIGAWGSARGLIIFAVGAVGFDLATTFAWPSVGAGNSAATFTLAASVTGLAAVKVREPAVVLLAAVTAGCGIFLLALGDAHGSAVAGGLVIGALTAAISPPGSGRRDRLAAAGGMRAAGQWGLRPTACRSASTKMPPGDSTRLTSASPARWLAQWWNETVLTTSPKTAG
jgi:hypothetical protein